MAVPILIAVKILLLMQLKSAQSFKCDEGPPGRYCTKDLSAYHICEYLPTGLKDTLVQCPDGTRCSCHFGPKCPSKIIDPCSEYVQPPVYDYSFTMRYHGIINNEAPVTVPVRHLQGLCYQYSAGLKSRQSFIDWVDGNRRDTLIVPAAAGNWIKYKANAGKCTKSSISNFPVFQVPWNFNADGHEMILGFQTTRWKRITGGRTTGSHVKIQYMYSRYDEAAGVTRPVRIYNIERGLRWTRRTNMTLGLFYAKLSPSSMDLFRKPAIC